MSDRVVIELTELENAGSRARNARSFGVAADNAIYSYEVPESDYDGAAIFWVIGFMEGLRFAGREGVLLTKSGKAVVSHNDGRITLRDEDGDVLDGFETWPEALLAARE